MEFQYHNPRFYTIYRYKLEQKPADIFKELKELFNLEGISRGCIYSWTHQFRNENNETKRIRWFQFDDQTWYDHLKFDLKNSTESNWVKGIQFYALCRVQLHISIDKILDELIFLFQEYAPTESILTSWIKEYWKDKNDSISVNDFDQLVKNYEILKEDYSNLERKFKKFKMNSQNVKSEPIEEINETENDSNQSKLDQFEFIISNERKQNEKLVSQLKITQEQVASLNEEKKHYQKRFEHINFAASELKKVNDDLIKQNQMLREELTIISNCDNTFFTQSLNTNILSSKYKEIENYSKDLESLLKKSQLNEQTLLSEINMLKAQLNIYSTSYSFSNEESINLTQVIKSKLFT